MPQALHRPRSHRSHGAKIKTFSGRYPFPGTVADHQSFGAIRFSCLQPSIPEKSIHPFPNRKTNLSVSSASRIRTLHTNMSCFAWIAPPEKPFGAELLLKKSRMKVLMAIITLPLPHPQLTANSSIAGSDPQVCFATILMEKKYGNATLEKPLWEPVLVKVALL